MQNKLNKLGVIPVISIDSLEDAIPIATQLIESKFDIIEVTLRSPCAIEAIKKIKETYPQMMIGIGTVTSKTQIDEILDLNPAFIVTPGFNINVVKYALEKELVIIPGIDNAALIEQANECGINFVKFFPAEASGGLPKIKALSGPYSHMNFMPTGGVNLSNLNDYLGFSKVIAVGGTFFLDKNKIKEKDYTHIKENCNKVIQKLLDLKIETIEISDTNSLPFVKSLLGISENQIKISNKNKIVVTTSSMERFNHFYPEFSFFNFEVDVKER